MFLCKGQCARNIWLILFIVLLYLGQLFPELRTYSENQVETVTCPRNCSRDGDSVTFCIFDSASNASNHLNTYLSDNELVGKPRNDCNGRTSGSGTAFISFTVKQRMSGSTIYCVSASQLCGSLHNTLISPLLINVEGMCVGGFIVGAYMGYLA